MPKHRTQVPLPYAHWYVARAAAVSRLLFTSLRAPRAPGLMRGETRHPSRVSPPPPLRVPSPQVTLLFADIMGFTEMCHSVQPAIVMQFLNQLYSRLGELLMSYSRT